MRLFTNLKARILKSIITWSEMGKQTAQAKEVYLTIRPVARKRYGPIAKPLRAKGLIVLVSPS